MPLQLPLHPEAAVCRCRTAVVVAVAFLLSSPKGICFCRCRCCCSVCHSERSEETRFSTATDAPSQNFHRFISKKWHDFQPRKTCSLQTTLSTLSHRLLTTKNHLLPPTYSKTPFKNTSKNNKTPDRSGVHSIRKKLHKITTKKPSSPSLPSLIWRSSSSSAAQEPPPQRPRQPAAASE